MDKQNRKAIIAGNWKMNKTATEAKALISELIPAVKDAGCEVVICVPFTDLVTAVEMTKGTNIHVGAENVHFEKSGAFTGENAPSMLKAFGCTYSLVGHSERRTLHAETDDVVAAKYEAIQKGGLVPVLCIGETLEQFEAGVTKNVVETQLKAVIDRCGIASFANAVVAYEPVWAIGTGKTASAEQAEEIHAHIRATLAAKYGNEVADNCTILYGGSCNAGNAKELFAKPNVDGGLIGGAALKVADFKGIIDAFN